MTEYLPEHYRAVDIPADFVEGCRVMDPHMAPTGAYEAFGMPCYR